MSVAMNMYIHVIISGRFIAFQINEFPMKYITSLTHSVTMVNLRTLIYCTSIFVYNIIASDWSCRYIVYMWYKHNL